MRYKFGGDSLQTTYGMTDILYGIWENGTDSWDAIYISDQTTCSVLHYWSRISAPKMSLDIKCCECYRGR